MSKLAKSDVRYHIAGPDQDHCGECKWFARPNGCELVKGTISPDGWCKIYHQGGQRRRTTHLAGKSDTDRDYVRKMRAT